MAGYTSSTLSQQVPERSRLRVPARGFSLKTAFIVFVGLLILFRWLHLILALQLASTGRQIQIATEEVHKIERQNAALVREISEAESPANLANRAAGQGYAPRQQIYLRTDLPLARPEAGAEQQWAIDSLEGLDRPDSGVSIGATSLAPWDTLSPEFGLRAQAETAP